ncbi:hypothetical protein KAR91_60535 [Candidatus Pacearchaeota archaeon]|nr:hypothetical protein [Candidatus Pacearchaeota archaeon]
MEIKIEGLKCDAKGCSYEDNNVKVEDYESYLNKPCPVCGANLLTEQDLATVKKLMKLANNPLLKALEDHIEKTTDEEKKTLKVDMNGTGQIFIDEGEE